MPRVGYEVLLDEFEERMSSLGYPFTLEIPVRFIRSDERIRFAIREAYIKLLKELRRMNLGRQGELFTVDTEAEIAAIELTSLIINEARTTAHDDEIIDFHPSRNPYTGPEPNNWPALLAGTEFVFTFDPPDPPRGDGPRTRG